VDLHHIQARATLGQHELDNLLTLCGAHHRAVHRGELVIEGRVSRGLRFQHADGTAYGGAVAAGAADVRAKAFRALRSLGFAEHEVHQALRDVTHVGSPAPLDSTLRAALARLSESALAKAS
jgi:hypothetical protein